MQLFWDWCDYVQACISSLAVDVDCAVQPNYLGVLVEVSTFNVLDLTLVQSAFYSSC